jgi:hypothetical protein
MRIAINFLLAGVLLAGFAPVAVSAGEINETRALAAFDQVAAASGIEVTLSCGAAPNAVLHGEAEDVADTEVRVESHVLHVERKAPFGNHRLPVKVAVTVSQPLDMLSVKSGASLDAPACAISTDHLDLSGSSGGTMQLAANTDRLVIEANSGATIAPLRGTRIDARKVTVSAKSGADIRVCSVRHLDGQASSGGSVVGDIGEMGDVSTSSGGSISSERCS